MIVAGALALCLARFAQLIQTGSVNVLFGDQWDFLSPLFRGEDPWSLFVQQHGPHRQGLGGILQWMLYRLGGWDVRWETWAGFATLVASAIAAVVLAARIRGRLVWWDSALVFIILSTLHWETLLLAPNLAHSILPLGLTLLLVHAWFTSGLVMRVVSVGFIGALCTFTGFGFCASAAAGLVALASTSGANLNRSEAGWILSLLLGGVALFLIGYQWAPAIPGWHFPVNEWWNYGTFGAYMGATLVGLRERSWLAIMVGGAVCILAVAVLAVSLWQIWSRGATKRAVASALLTGTSLNYMVYSAVGRLPASIEAAFMWRYTSLTMAGALGMVIYIAAGMETATAFWRRVAIGAICIFAATIWINFGPEQRVRIIAEAKQSWVRAYLETGDLTRANEQSNFWVYPPQPNAPHIAERLQWLARSNLGFFKGVQVDESVKAAH